MAGHVIECGAQATGGNYSFFTEVPDLRHAGFPIAEIAADGSSRHHASTPARAGRSTIGTVTSQLLYEIGSPRYLNPDVVARFDTIALSDDGAGPGRHRRRPGRAAAADAQGRDQLRSAATATTFTVALTGLDIEAKAGVLEAAGSGPRCPAGATPSPSPVPSSSAPTTRIRPRTKPPPRSCRLTVKDPDERQVGRAFSSVAIELALASIPGFYGLGGPAPASPYGVFWPDDGPGRARARSTRRPRGRPRDGRRRRPSPDGPPPTIAPLVVDVAPAPSGPTLAAPLGRVVGARSGDKGGDANLGVFARSAEAYAWLAGFLSVERLRALMPAETDGLEVRRYELPNLWALNFLIVGLLEEGVAGSSRMDGQAKSLGEYLRAKVVDVPEVVLAGAAAASSSPAAAGAPGADDLAAG